MNKNIKIILLIGAILFLIWALQTGYLIYIIATAEGLAIANLGVYVLTGVASAIVSYILTKYKNQIIKKL